MATILVTGGAGFIGSHLVSRFVNDGHDVRILDNLSSGKRENLESDIQRVTLIEGDICDRKCCDQAMAGVEFVFHLAAVPSVPRSVDEPQLSHDVNMNGTFIVLRAAVDAQVRRVIYAASSSAYGDTEVSPKHEELRSEPLSPYAVQKCAGEQYGRAFFECFGLETISLRYFNVFGERQDPGSEYAAAIPAFVMSILKREPPVVYGDGEQTRDFTYIDNVVHGNCLAMGIEKTHGEVVNVSCGDQISVNQVIAAVNNMLATNVRPRHVDPRVGDVRHSCADIHKAKTLLGYEPIVPFEEGLRRSIDYYKTLASCCS